ncbi:MAG: hypothetical protein IPM99_10670 [Rubrivivax sp.]|jgi:hypothetical protein|nr:hypothetical protein [Rubrivivax sp.]
MKTLPTDSPEALARVLAMMIVTDAELDARELDMLEQLDAFGRIGITREGFRATAQQYCAELGARMGDRAWLQLSDVMLIDEILRPVQGTAQRLLVARLSAAIITADGRVHDIERLVFDHMLARWGLTRAAVSRAILADRRQAA